MNEPGEEEPRSKKRSGDKGCHRMMRRAGEGPRRNIKEERLKRCRTSTPSERQAADHREPATCKGKADLRGPATRDRGKDADFRGPATHEGEKEVDPRGPATREGGKEADPRVPATRKKAEVDHRDPAKRSRQL